MRHGPGRDRDSIAAGRADRKPKRGGFLVTVAAISSGKENRLAGRNRREAEVRLGRAARADRWVLRGRRRRVGEDETGRRYVIVGAI